MLRRSFGGVCIMAVNSRASAQCSLPLFGEGRVDQFLISIDGAVEGELGGKPPPEEVNAERAGFDGLGADESGAPRVESGEDEVQSEQRKKEDEQCGRKDNICATIQIEKTKKQGPLQTTLFRAVTVIWN